MSIATQTRPVGIRTNDRLWADTFTARSDPAKFQGRGPTKPGVQLHVHFPVVDIKISERSRDDRVGSTLKRVRHKPIVSC